jgi:MazG family protein
MHTEETTPDQAFLRLLKIMDELREKCPWDKVQTWESLRHLTIEETYELSDSILNHDLEGLKKELGDVLLHIVFYAKIASEQDLFNITNVINVLCEKLIFRHPHVFGETVAENEQVVKQNWEKLKLKEKDINQSVLSGVPNSLPALIKAWRIQQKAHGVGFDWNHQDQVFEKIQEELTEFHQAITQENQEEEFGDLLFSLVNYARFINIEPETALEKANRKFMRRFQAMEQAILKDNKSVQNLSLSEMDNYWNQIKKGEQL